MLEIVLSFVVLTSSIVPRELISAFSINSLIYSICEFVYQDSIKSFKAFVALSFSISSSSWRDSTFSIKFLTIVLIVSRLAHSFTN